MKPSDLARRLAMSLEILGARKIPTDGLDRRVASGSNSPDLLVCNATGATHSYFGKKI